MPSARELLVRLRRRPFALGAATVLAIAVVALLALAGHDGSDGSDDATSTSPNGACVVRLHGKGGTGASTVVDGAATVVRPTGNAAGWGKRQWLYFPAAEYTAARTVVADAITAAGCTRVALSGFSNGGAFAAALYCHGETFDGRLVGVMIDDPVTDHAVDSCAPQAGIPVVLYWTGALEGQAVPGWSCAAADWTCDGGSTIGIAAYATALRTAPIASPHTEHEPNDEAQEPATWLAG